MNYYYKTMATNSVSVLSGIGPKTAEALQRYNITTVKQLSEANPDTVKIKQIRTLIQRAKDHLNVEPIQVLDSLPKLVLGKIEKSKEKSKEKPEEKSEEKSKEKSKEKSEEKSEQPEKKTEDVKEQYLICDHTWFECKVVAPDNDTLREAIVYELCIDPSERISFVCEWVEDDTHVNTMSYSPQLLLHFNLDLPPLNVSIRPEDFESLPNKVTLENVLWEIGQMQNCI